MAGLSENAAAERVKALEAVLRKVGRKLMPIEDTVPIAKEAQRLILEALRGAGNG